MKRPTTILLVCLLPFAGCLGGRMPRTEVCAAVEALPGEERILAIGDSVFAWRNQKCRTIPDIVALTLNRRVKHVAVNGARVTGGDHQIISQYAPGAWDWVIVDGGGNDLNNECECGQTCDDTLDRLVTKNGLQGELPRLVDAIVADGARVLVYGYFEVSERARYGFNECIGEIDELRSRQARIAATRDRVIFVDGRDVVTVAGTPGAYAFDHVHPSREGARLVGELLAKRILEAER